LTAILQIAAPPNSLSRRLVLLWLEESGQDMVEYALVAVAMGLGTVAGVHGLASSIGNDLNIVLHGFNDATGLAH
jgi:Flp pilus assembly pilin Flp